ncbi:MAG: ribokinase [Bacteroidetes bacterium]|nr:MAG: ribokinase [Bacteroidota bacterium]
MSPQIVVIGSSNTDMVVLAPRLPRPGEAVGGGLYFQSHGGRGANQAVAAARAGGRVGLVAAFGQDAFGESAIRSLLSEGVDISCTVRERGASGIALVMVDGNGQNCMSIAPGANELLAPAHIDQALSMIRAASIILIQLEIPYETAAYAARLAAENGKKVLLNPAPAHPLDAALAGCLHMLILNESEAETLSGIPVKNVEDAAFAAQRLRHGGPSNVIITLGPLGAWVCSEDWEGHMPAWPAHPMDTTAAGDVFCGALAVALAEKEPLQEAVRFASAAAAISITRPGSQPSVPRREEIEALMEGALVL